MATNDPIRLAWDSNIIIDSLEKEKSDRYEWVKPLVHEADEGRLILVISSIAIAETCRLDGKDVHVGDEIVRDFFDRPFIELHAADKSVAMIAREIRTKFDIDGADSIHLGTAIMSGVSILLTNDGDSKRQRNKKKNPTPLLPLDGKLLSNGTPLRIITPKQFDEMQRDSKLPMWAKPEKK